MSKQTVTINGVLYDAQTGLPVNASVPAREPAVTFTPPVKVHPSHEMHRRLQKSHTLKRQIVKKQPGVTPATATPVVHRSPAISRFAPHPVGAKPTVRRVNDIAPATHPLAAKAVSHAPARRTTTHAHAPKPSQVIKQEAIAEALAKAPAHNITPTKAPRRRHARITAVMSASLALLLLGGYFTYLNMPNLSVRVAAVQAGINATYPGYQPDGYSVHGPVAYSQNGVSMTFAANGGPQSYTIEQAKSSLDSSAVLESYVKPKAGGSYIPYSQQGLTIYIYGNNAAWVNGGILYTINGDAPLSSDQILHIASSM